MHTTTQTKVKDVLTTTPFPVLLVDDGSETPVSNVLYSWDVRQALEDGRVRVARFDKNRGKGSALQFAIQDLVGRGFTHMVTMDGDGQHHAHEICKLADLAKDHPWDLIIGDRKLKSATVPTISKFGRKFSNFWVNYQTGLHVKDSQSGFRLYPLFPLQNIKFISQRFDFEIEVLIRLLWNGIKVREIEIDVHYPEPGDRVSHLHKLWDNVRISLLNTVLVVVSLLKTHRAPGELALALGLGVFVGCTPFYGFHTLIIAALAFALRLNLIVMWLGSHVSTPIFAPFIIMLEIWIGRHWLNVAPAGGPKGDFYQWMAGSGVLGLLLGGGTTIVTFALAWYLKNRKKGSNWTGRTRGGRLGNGFLKLVLRYGGLQSGYFCLAFVAPYFYLFAPAARRGLNEYWKLVEPVESWRQRQMRIVRHFYRFGQVLMDRVFQTFHQEKQFPLHQTGMDYILKGMREKKGLIMLSAHMGAWDLATALLSGSGFSEEIHVVEYQAEGLSFQKVKAGDDPKHVRSVNANSAQASDAIFEIHSALRKGRCLALMGDRPIGDRFELIPFMGKLAPFDMTPFRLAAACKVPLLLTFGFKGQNNYYDFFADPSRVFEFDGKLPREVQCYNWCKEYIVEMEKFVRRYPDQWFNFYPFWSALPSAPNGELAAQSNNNLLEELESRLFPKSELAPGSMTNGEV